MKDRIVQFLRRESDDARSFADSTRRDKRRRSLLFAAFALGLLSPSSAAAEETGGGWRRRFSPADHLYPVYVADPRRPATSFELAVVDRSIPDTGDMRFGLRAGGCFPVVRFHRAGSPDRGIEIAIAAGFRGLFDFDNSWDSIGWDGLYGVHVSWAPEGKRFALRFAGSHDSSHIGDEYAERTGRQRIDYTREEMRLGISAPVGRAWRTYGEAAWSFNLEEYQEAGRAQAGIEWHSPRTIWGGHASWYAAFDANAYQENDWELDAALQGGLALPVPDAARTWRLAVTLYDGRSLIGELFAYDEPTASLGVWLDF